jgi:chromosome segregation ATPase
MMTPAEKQTILITVIAALPGLLAGVVALWVAIKKNPHDIAKTDAETERTKAETDDLHAKIADRWAEHVGELQEKVRQLEEAREQDKKQHAQAISDLHLDINQVRRENESYRIELAQRDAIIEDLKDWAARLTRQVIEHAPHIIPEKYYRRKNDAG